MRNEDYTFKKFGSLRGKKREEDSWKERQVFIQMGEMLLAWIQQREKDNIIGKKR